MIYRERLGYSSFIPACFSMLFSVPIGISFTGCVIVTLPGLMGVCIDNDYLLTPQETNCLFKYFYNLP